MANDRHRAPVTASHAKMLALLDRIRERTPDENSYLGDRQARELRQALAAWQPDDGPAKLWQLHGLLGNQEIKLGNEEVGIDHLEKAYKLLPEVADQIRDRGVHETIFSLAVGYLRLGETENCCSRNTPESCIVPIRGGGIHTRPEGSVTAIRYLRELLESDNLETKRELIARWLLNVAYMTIGEYPDSVPKEFLIPPERFLPDQDFPHFQNIASELGVDSFNLSGATVIDDFNGDGYLDIFTTTWNTSGEPHLFINDAKGGFVDRSRQAGLEGLYGGLDAVQADYDNDGDVDILILRGAWLEEHGHHPNSLLANDGTGVFTDVTFDARLGAVHYPTHSAAWADYDNDGDLDLYVGNETTPGVRAPGQLFRNNGDGTFIDIAPDAGVENLRFAKGVVWGDYDGDRFPDLYISNYLEANRLYHNNGDDTFSDVAPQLNVQRPMMSFPVWFWDFDNDGALDLFVSSYSGQTDTLAAQALGRQPAFEPPCLYRGDGQGGFEDVTERSGLIAPMRPMGANFGDINNDGYPDFYLGTGDPMYWSVMPNLCYVNREGKKFDNVTMASGLGHLQKGHGVSFADFDNDGDLDIFEEMGGAFPGDEFNDALYENPGFGNNWVAVELVGVQSNRSAIGARLHAKVVDPSGAVRSVYRHVTSGGSFGANPLRQTIGLGKEGTVRSLEVYWPTTDKTQRFENVPIGCVIQVVEGRSQFTVRNLKTLSFHAQSPQE